MYLKYEFLVFTMSYLQAIYNMTLSNSKSNVNITICWQSTGDQWRQPALGEADVHFSHINYPLLWTACRLIYFPRLRFLCPFDLLRYIYCQFYINCVTLKEWRIMQICFILPSECKICSDILQEFVFQNWDLGCFIDMVRMMVMVCVCGGFSSHNICGYVFTKWLTDWPTNGEPTN